MYLAFSALNRQAEPTNQNSGVPANERMIRYQAYRHICHKYSSHITEIQKYFPGWMPSFSIK
ncbi:MAG: hypothetical protein ACXVA2_21965 [Mucilaginibacter sp.]